ncbi:MAG: methylamine dehydrogenase light chain [Myxococcales bacterium]|nr:methylamine dehydrogenase (amicyanin) light chain [Myxococcales bacterium]HIK85372.1 methylamine dehydrogenase (amicyanin) light chain [Myxococcales bacterium]
MKSMDEWIEDRSRAIARGTSRRTFVARLGALLTAGTVLPLLPVARASANPNAKRVPAPVETIEGPAGDPKSCEYWRHCAIDGFACACCGGSSTTCPPGTEVSPVTWVGTCLNPADGKDYLISYNDCCGKTMCGRCVCNRNEGERPEYHWYRNNDINWCAGATSQVYNCSIAVVIGQATERQPEN